MAYQTIRGIQWDPTGLSEIEKREAQMALGKTGEEFIPGTRAYRAKMGLDGLGYGGELGGLGAAGGREEEFMKRYRETIAGQPTMAALARRHEEELGLPGMREAYTGLQQALIGAEQQLYRQPGEIEAQTRRFGVSAPQLARIKEARAEPLRRDIIQMAGAAERARVGLTGAEEAMTRRLGYETLQLDRQLLPFATEAQLLQSRASRELTGYTAAAQRELDERLERLRIEGIASESDLARAHELATLEQQHLNTLEELRRKKELGIGVSTATTLPAAGLESLWSQYFG